MMASFLTRFGVYNDNTFKARVGIAAVGAAVAVASENVMRPAVNRKRAALSALVLANPATVADRFALILAAQDVPVDEPDEALQNHIRDVWDAIAGVTAEDRGQS